jgi:hypothetical protein
LGDITIEQVEAAVRRVLESHTPAAWLNTAQAAEYLKANPDTLETWRKRGCGPRHHGGHRFVRYHVDDLDAWMRGESGR